MSADCSKLKHSNCCTRAHKGDFPKFGHNYVVSQNKNFAEVQLLAYSSFTSLYHTPTPYFFYYYYQFTTSGRHTQKAKPVQGVTLTSTYPIIPSYVSFSRSRTNQLFQLICTLPLWFVINSLMSSLMRELCWNNLGRNNDIDGVGIIPQF